jgi:hypothetical protein
VAHVHPALVGVARLLARQAAREALACAGVSEGCNNCAGVSEGCNNTEPRTSP